MKEYIAGGSIIAAAGLIFANWSNQGPSDGELGVIVGLMLLASILLGWPDRPKLHSNARKVRRR